MGERGSGTRGSRSSENSGGKTPLSQTEDLTPPGGPRNKTEGGAPPMATEVHNNEPRVMTGENSGTLNADQIITPMKEPGITDSFEVDGNGNLHAAMKANQGRKESSLESEKVAFLKGKFKQIFSNVSINDGTAGTCKEGNFPKAGNMPPGQATGRMGLEKCGGLI